MWKCTFTQSTLSDQWKCWVTRWYDKLFFTNSKSWCKRVFYFTRPTWKVLWLTILASFDASSTHWIFQHAKNTWLEIMIDYIKSSRSKVLVRSSIAVHTTLHLVDKFQEACGAISRSSWSWILPSYEEMSPWASFRSNLFRKRTRQDLSIFSRTETLFSTMVCGSLKSFDRWNFEKDEI